MTITGNYASKCPYHIVTYERGHIDCHQYQAIATSGNTLIATNTVYPAV